MASIKELCELVDETKNLLKQDFESENGKPPTTKDLLKHVKDMFKNGQEDTILNELFLEDVECPEDFYKLLFIFAASKK